MSESKNDKIARLLISADRPVEVQRPLILDLDEYHRAFPLDEGMHRSHESLINEGFETKRRRLQELEARKSGLHGNEDLPDGEEQQKT